MKTLGFEAIVPAVVEVAGFAKSVTQSRERWREIQGAGVVEKVKRED